MADSKSEIEKSATENNENFVAFSLDDKNIMDLGKVIQIEYSREILKITQHETLNLQKIAKGIAKNNKFRLSNATHHKKRLKKIGLIKSTQKLHRKKSGFTLEAYTGVKIIIIAQDELIEKIRNSKELKDAFDHILKG